MTEFLGRILKRVSRAPKWVCLCLIIFYRSCISPHFPACCRYVPTCSQYAITAIERFGVIRGCWLAFCRILRCNPVHEGGYDPVPDRFENRRRLFRKAR